MLILIDILIILMHLWVLFLYIQITNNKEKISLLIDKLEKGSDK